MATVKRYDFGTIRSVERTPQGGIVVPAALTRVGVFVYQLPNGNIRRELRLPEEVFNADSLASLKLAPVTDLHPEEMVTPENWRDLAVGHVAENVTQDGSHVLASLVVQDAEAIRKIGDGERKELSCGYHCTLEMTPGEYNGEPYDAIQRGIVYNHVALGPEGWARGGSTCALRLDSQDAIQVERENMGTIRIDGTDYKIGSPEHIAKLDGDLAKARSERDAAQGRADMAESKLAAAEKKIAELSDVKRLDGIVKARAELYTVARRYLGKRFDCSDKSEAEIKIAVIKKLDGEFKADGKSAEYIDGAFQSLIRFAERRDEGDEEEKDDEGDEEEEKEDEEEEKEDEEEEKPKNDGGVRGLTRPRTNKPVKRMTADAAREKLRQDSAKAYQKPLAWSKDR